MRTEVVWSVDFGVGGNAADYQLYGWSAPENGFTWTLGSESAIGLPRFESRRGFYVEVALSPVSKSQSFSISVNGTVVSCVDNLDDGLFAFRVSPIHWQDRLAVITFGHPDAVQMDERVLAFAFRRIRILNIVDDWAMPPFIVRPHFLNSFESLGVNCEFGFVQRHAGLEPLGLLRFSGSELERTVAGLDSNWNGIDSADDIVPFDTGTVWHVRHRRYALDMHTFIKNGEATSEEIRSRETNRLRFLADKLTNDAHEAEKIFVIQRRNRLSEAEVLPVFLALRRRGPCRLLWLVPGDEAQQTESVEMVSDGLFRGCLRRFSPPGRHFEPDTESWLAVLKAAAQLCV
jgi:hypothetical protein